MRITVLQWDPEQFSLIADFIKNRVVVKSTVTMTLHHLTGLQHVPMLSMEMSGESQAIVTMEMPASTATLALSNSSTQRFTSLPNATTSSRMATVPEGPSVPLPI